MIAAFITGLFTLLAGLGGTLGVYLHSDAKKKKSVRLAIIAEIHSIIEVAEQRSYRLGMLQGITGEINCFSFEVPNYYRSVFDGNVGNIGLLDASEAEKIVYFYMMIGSLVVSFKPGGVMDDPNTASQDGFIEALKTYDEALKIGKSIIEGR